MPSASLPHTVEHFTAGNHATCTPGRDAQAQMPATGTDATHQTKMPTIAPLVILSEGGGSGWGGGWYGERSPRWG